MKKTLVILLVVIMMLSGCEKEAEITQPAVQKYEYSTISQKQLFVDPGWTQIWSNAVQIDLQHLDGNSEAYQYSEGSLKLKTAGSYILQGKLDGNIVIKADDILYLGLKGVSAKQLDIKSDYDVYLYAFKNSENSFSDSDNAITSSAILNIWGDGSITLSGNIKAKKEVYLCDASVEIYSGKSGINTEGLCAVSNTKLTIHSVKEGIKASAYYQFSGDVSIVSEDDGISCSDVFLAGGQLSVSCSKKGILSQQSIIMEDGQLTVQSNKDAIYSKGYLNMKNGTVSIDSGGNGLHGDIQVEIYGGSIQISNSKEGIESHVILVEGGDILLQAGDDGINGSGNDGQALISIMGGNIEIHTTGDGIDCNGDIYVGGGQVIIAGPFDSLNGALDHDGYLYVENATLLALSLSEKEQIINEDNPQEVLYYQLNSPASGTLTLLDDKGNTILEYEMGKQYQMIQLSCPELKKGKKYQLICGEKQITFKMKSQYYVVVE